jgi:hypothetical protein
MDPVARRKPCPTAWAVTTSTVPSGTTQVLSNGMGGYNVYGPSGTSQIMSNGMGGYNTYGPGGTMQTMPNGLGGFNTC